MNIKKNFFLIVPIYLFIYLIIPHTEYQPADPGIKILQMRDLIDSGFSTFSANYKARSFDASLKYFPTKPPFAYLIKEQAYYVFPYFLSIFLSPFYALGGIYLLEFLSLLSGLLVIYICYLIANELTLDTPLKKLMILFLSLGSINSIYSFMFGEAIHASLLLTLSFYLLIKKDKLNKTWLFYFCAGVLSGISVMLRIELALFCFLLLIGTILFRIYDKKSDLFYLSFGLAIPALVLVSANYSITENILGLRGIEFLNYSGSAYPIKYRFINEIKALFGSSTALGLFSAWPIFLFLVPFFIYQNKLQQTNSLKFTLFISATFTLLVPILVKNADGSILGPRFAATVQPLLILGTFKAIELLKANNKITFLISKLRFFIYYSIFITIVGYVILFYFLKMSKELNLELDKNMTGEWIILRNDDLYSAVLPSYPKRVILEIDDSLEIENFLQKNKSNLPNTLSIISSKPKNDIEKPVIIFQSFELENTFTKKGFLVQNYKRKQ